MIIIIPAALSSNEKRERERKNGVQPIERQVSNVNLKYDGIFIAPICVIKCHAWDFCSFKKSNAVNLLITTCNS